MTTPAQDQNVAPKPKQPLKTEQQSDVAFSVAKEALGYIGTFGTPPIPEVYEVWYRYAEGNNKAICEQLSHSVNVAKSVTTSQLRDLRKQFLADSETSEANGEISEKLAREVADLQSIISSHQGANAEFGGSVATVSDRLRDGDVSTAEIKTCIDSVLQGSDRMQHKIAEMDSKLQSSKSQIDGLMETLAELNSAMHMDPLTGIGNRRAFDKEMLNCSSTKPTAGSRYLFLVDLDSFKGVNDSYGHAAGDKVLRFVASTLKQLIPEASIARYGGDEFAVFVNLAGPDQAKELANEVCLFFFGNELTLNKTAESIGKLTVSLGAACRRVDDTSESWFERADKLLYGAKSSGRNRAMVERTLVA